MANEAERRKLSQALGSLESEIKKHKQVILNLFKVAEALNENIVAIGRMMKEKQDDSD